MIKNLNHNTQDHFSKVYRIYFPKLVRFSQAYVRSEEEAENIVQNLFLYLWEHKEVLDSLNNQNAFLFTLVKNRCIDYLRKQIQAGSKQSLSEIEEKELELKLYSLQKFDENKLSREEIDQIITSAIDSLPPRCKEIFILSRLEGLSHKEIAGRLNISTNTIEGQIAIALKKLRVQLKDYVPLFLFLI
ncbi:RNA polymerase sigma-70 factor [Massilibacteroides sp.]|uniref:RNA polymerase sigma-70 factor n=1 Tax=Massilibacteroides sp. TaxID=2034766 RepID=UPI002629570E|nr:RNA polymerase sigma-70 factor [Massilibacteroides sp.]MDD4514050.1 RNA polymerase sigma-70 factor [Massilibacteroides sp.]